MRDEVSPQADRARETRIGKSTGNTSTAGGHRSERILLTQRHLLELIATGKPLTDVLQALVGTIEDQCEDAVGAVMLMDDEGERLHLGAAPSLPVAYTQAMDGLRIGNSAGCCGTAAYRGERVVVQDIDKNPIWSDLRGLAREHGLRACWSQPIFSSDRTVVGTLAMYYRNPRRPGNEDLEYTEVAAHLAGIAIERHRAEQKKRAAEQRLLRQKTALVELAKSEQLAAGDFEAFAKLATRTAAETLGVERVSVWSFNDDRTILRCEILYELSLDRCSAGAELEARMYPRYFAAMERGRSVVAHEARRDDDTSEFADAYLIPLGITSMLDAPIRRAGKLTGVVCHEHVGPSRVWAADEQDLAASVGDFLALALEASERRLAQQQFRSAQEELLRQQFQARRQIEFQLDSVKGDLVHQTRLATIGQVAASLAHDLRNPLGAIRNAVYYLARRVPEDEPEWGKYLGMIQREIGRADVTVSDLLEMSQAKDPWKEPVQLAGILHEAFAYSGGQDRVRLRLDLQPEDFVVTADPGQLKQVLVNLMTNAVQAMRGRGEITVEARREAGFDSVTIRDDGPGVEPELRPRVFAPLVTNKDKGTGLGLAICRQIVERHGGTIALLDDDPAGTAFRIRLPGHVASTGAVGEPG